MGQQPDDSLWDQSFLYCIQALDVAYALHAQASTITGPGSLEFISIFLVVLDVHRNWDGDLGRQRTGCDTFITRK